MNQVRIGQYSLMNVGLTGQIEISEETKEKEPKKRDIFPTIQSNEVAKQLDEYINSLKAKSEHYNSTVNIGNVQKTRKNVKENLSYALVSHFNTDSSLVAWS